MVNYFTMVGKYDYRDGHEIVEAKNTFDRTTYHVDNPPEGAIRDLFHAIANAIIRIQAPLKHSCNEWRDEYYKTPWRRNTQHEYLPNIQDLYDMLECSIGFRILHGIKGELARFPVLQSHVHEFYIEQKFMYDMYKLVNEDVDKERGDDIPGCAWYLVPRSFLNDFADMSGI